MSYRKIYFSDLGVSLAVGTYLFSMGRQFWDRLREFLYTRRTSPVASFEVHIYVLKSVLYVVNPAYYDLINLANF
jgi:hypothetical protein